MAVSPIQSAIAQAGRVAVAALDRVLDKLPRGDGAAATPAEQAVPEADDAPELNGGHGIGGMAPEEGPVPIEEEPADLSIVGHGHEDKAAWNRERVAQLQALEDEPPAVSADPDVPSVPLADLPADVLADDSMIDEGGEPALAEEMSDADDDLALEERLVATPGEDILSAGAEFGLVEAPMAEETNMDDDIARQVEEDRETMPDADPNESRGG